MNIGAIGNVGEREIVYIQTFIMPKNEPLFFSFSPSHYDVPQLTVSYNKFTLNVILKMSENESDEITAEWTTRDNKNFLVITLPAVRNQWGPGITETPMKVGQVAGRPLGFYAAYSPSTSGMGLVTIQFMLGGNYE